MPEIMSQKPRQREFVFRSHGGARKGAGRPRTGRVSHEKRPQFARVTPVHVTLRMRQDVANLRRARAFRALARCFKSARDRFQVRIVEFSVQGNHIHFILEADDNEALTRAMRGLTVRIAKALNALMRTHGRVLADTYHSRLLRTPTEVMNAIRYVLGNAAHHFGERDTDLYSSLRTDRDELVAPPRGWLLTVGWRKAKHAGGSG